MKDNIAYGKDGATTEEIRAAAELANAAKFIDKLPQVLNWFPLHKFLVLSFFYFLERRRFRSPAPQFFI
jgi:ABC-type multidrug transport system fused ATPase/permease subunit